MAMSKHTPGEWTAWQAPDGSWAVRTVYHDEQDRRTTTWPAVCNAGGQPNEANARLIAAAPDLWANGCAADTCLSIAYSYARELGRDDEARHINEVQVALRAAIAKAEGRS